MLAPSDDGTDSNFPNKTNKALYHLVPTVSHLSVLFCFTARCLRSVCFFFFSHHTLLSTLQSGFHLCYCTKMSSMITLSFNWILSFYCSHYWSNLCPIFSWFFKCSLLCPYSCKQPLWSGAPQSLRLSLLFILLSDLFLHEASTSIEQWVCRWLMAQHLHIRLLHWALGTMSQTAHLTHSLGCLQITSKSTCPQPNS